MISEDAAKAKKALVYNPVQRVLTDKDFLSTGITLLNLATYNRVFGGMAKGFLYRLIGKSQTAKSFVSRMILAEAANNPEFDKYELIHDDIEKGVLMNDVKFFGTKLAARIRAPMYSKEGKKPIMSRTIMDMFDRMNKKLDAKKKFIWIVDSFDALQSMTTTKMGDGKAKIAADKLRGVIDDRLVESGSIIIFVHHAKTNMSQEFTWGPKPDVTTGGLSPEFYSTADIRLSKLSVIKKVIKGKKAADADEDDDSKDRKIAIGNWIGAHVTKNRLSGMDRTIRFSLYPSVGIDDLGSCVDFLIANSHWEKQKGGIVQSEEFDFEGSPEKLIQHIEITNQERELRVLTGRVWQEIEQACSLQRKPRYE